MVTDHLMDRLGSQPILSVKRSVSIGTMLNFDRDSDGTCKQADLPELSEKKNQQKAYL